METQYIFNHFYKLRHDIKRSHILSPTYIPYGKPGNVEHNWTSLIHPALAMALSLFSEPQTLGELKKSFSYFFDISEEDAEKFIKMFLDNEETFTIQYEGGEYSFPKNIIIDAADQFVEPVSYTPQQFSFKELDFKTERFYAGPTTLVFMVNNTCATNCVYCYANKNVKSSLIEFERLKEIVREAREMHIKKFTLVGGEVFLYKRWKELLALLEENNLNETVISTKVPLTENDIEALKKFNLTVQISLDSVDSNALQTILDVNGAYAEKIKHFIGILNKNRIKFQISTVLTVYNGTVDHLKALYEFLSPFEYLQRWEIRVAFKSLYSRGDFDTIKMSRSDIEKIDEWINNVKENSNMNISWSAFVDDKYFKGEKGSRSFKGPRCSANYSNLFILPDGKVTICEQLYWDARFIIGDLTHQSIREVWNSPKALALAFPKKEDFSDKSVCKTCKIFDECMQFPNKCIADVLKGYGMEHPDFPDPRCNRAPAFVHSLLNE